jgi:hypothetical protein
VIIGAPDARLLQEGGVLRILVDRKQWKRTNDTWSAGAPRILKVGTLIR